MPVIKKLELVAELPIKKRGRPPGSKNKVKKKVEETEKVYRYYFIASACGCRIGADILGSGMWCKHKNTMHLETRDK